MEAKTGNKPLISVIMPCHNVAEYLPKCMESLENQSIGIENLELIFVDDASTDEGATWEKIMEFEKKHPEQVMAIHLEENIRQGGARNIGLQYASAEYIGFLDPDDWIEPEMYEKLYDKITAYSCEVAACLFSIDNDYNQYPEPDYPDELQSYEKSVAEGGDKAPRIARAIVVMLYQKSLILDNALWFPEKVAYEDVYWLAILPLYVKRVCYINDVLYHYVQRGDSTANAKDALHHEDALLIEEMKLEHYQGLGIFYKFYPEFEMSFFEHGYAKICIRFLFAFGELPHPVYRKLNDFALKNFPFYKNNPYWDNPEFVEAKTFRPLIEMNLTKKELKAFSKMVYENELIQQGRFANYDEPVAGPSFELGSKSDSESDSKLEVVFFPYQLSMWDSLESIYLAAREDPNCDAYVVPIPWFERMPDGSAKKAHYDGDQYPENIPVTNWQDYDVEKRRPDVIFIHNPYDGANLVTSVHPNYYSERLRNFTDLLCYVPYFVVGDEIEEHLCVTAGTLYADKVFLQSETVRDTYIRALREFEENNHVVGKFGNPEDKFLALGSPKLDKVINSKRSDFQLPKKWRKLIKIPNRTRKKVVLYNTSVGSILGGEEQHLAKLRYVLEDFKKRDDVVLWWRPHPLSEETYASMRPQFLAEYEQIVADYKQGKWGIYDDTVDVHRALALSDAYYGDVSSLVPMYNATGKPVLFQDINIANKNLIKGFNPNNEARLYFWEFVHKDNSIWFVSYFMNGLFCMDLDTNAIQYVGEIPREKAYAIGLITSMAIAGDFLILTPGLGDDIVKYDMRNHEFESMRIRDAGIPNKIKFVESYHHNGSIYMVPWDFPAVVKYDIENESIVENQNICAELDQQGTNREWYFSKGGVINGDYLLLPSGVGNIIVKYDLTSGNYKLHHVGNDNNQYMCIAYDGTCYWLFSKNGSIVKWNDKTGMVEELNSYPNGFDSGAYGFAVALMFEKDIFAFPADANMILKINTVTNEIEPLVNLGEREHLQIQKIGGINYYAKRIGDSIYATSWYEDSFQKINPRTGEIETIPLVLSKEDYAKVMYRPLFHDPSERVAYPFQEFEKASPFETLDFFLDHLAIEDIDNEKLSFKKVDQIFLNADGSCGKKIYDYIRESPCRG